MQLLTSRLSAHAQATSWHCSGGATYLHPFQLDTGEPVARSKLCWALRQADVVLRGYSGYNSAWALHLLAKVFPEGMRPPALITIFFGANDAVLRGRIRRVRLRDEWFTSAFLQQLSIDMAEQLSASDPQYNALDSDLRCSGAQRSRLTCQHRACHLQ